MKRDIEEIIETFACVQFQFLPERPSAEGAGQLACHKDRQTSEFKALKTHQVCSNLKASCQCC